MRLIIEARLEGAQTGATAAEATIVDVVERQDHSVADLGLTLAEGRALLAKVQSILVSQQTADWMASRVACCRCGSVLAHKDARELWRPLPQGAPYQQQHCRVGGQPGGQPSHGEEAANAMDRLRGALPGAGQSCRSKWGTLGAATCRIGLDAQRELVGCAPGCMIRPPTVWLTRIVKQRSN